MTIFIVTIFAETKKLELLNDIATIDIFHSFNEKKQLAEQGYWSYVFDYIQVNINRFQATIILVETFLSTHTFTWLFANHVIATYSIVSF